MDPRLPLLGSANGRPNGPDGRRCIWQIRDNPRPDLVVLEPPEEPIPGPPPAWGPRVLAAPLWPPASSQLIRHRSPRYGHQEPLPAAHGGASHLADLGEVWPPSRRFHAVEGGGHPSDSCRSFGRAA